MIEYKLVSYNEAVKNGWLTADDEDYEFSDPNILFRVMDGEAFYIMDEPGSGCPEDNYFHRNLYPLLLELNWLAFHMSQYNMIVDTTILNTLKENR